jgi:hypothetical protein
MNPLNRDFFMVYLPLLTFGWYAGWFARGWWEARHRADRVVGGIKELHPTGG